MRCEKPCTIPRPHTPLPFLHPLPLPLCPVPFWDAGSSKSSSYCRQVASWRLCRPLQIRPHSPSLLPDAASTC